MQEMAVAHINELVDGQMKEVKAGETKVLLARVGETVYAVDAVCPHYQAPLVKGLLCGHRLYCPWHHSCFDITDGNLLEPPSLDGLTTYPVRVANGQIWISLSDESPTPEPKEVIPDGDDRTMVILGGGAAGYFAAQTLRQQHFNGRIVLLTRENQLPYDRPKLSKNFLDGRAPAQKVPLRNETFYEQYHIEVQVDVDVTRIDADAHKIQFNDGSSMHYTALLVATGSTPSKLPVPGADLAGVFTLRSFSDAQAIVDQLTNTANAIIIGASFIGLEAAASLRKRGVAVTVVAPEKVPFEKILGPAIGAMFQKLHEANGVSFRFGTTVVAVTGNDHVAAVKLDNGEELPADMVLVGIGVKPNTANLTNLRLDEKDKSVLVDEYLQAAPDLFVAGDIASFPDARNSNTPTRIEHWRLAQQHGITAALTMLGQTKSVNESVPFFWTNQYEKRLSYVGHANDWDDIIVHGDIDKQDFIAFYVKGNRILAVASMNRDKDSIAIEELMRQNKLPAADEVREKLPDFTALV